MRALLLTLLLAMSASAVVTSVPDTIAVAAVSTPHVWTNIGAAPGNVQLPDDGTTSRVVSGTADNAHQWTLGSNTIPDDSVIDSVQVHIRATPAAAGNQVRVRLYLGGNYANGADQSLAAGYANYNITVARPGGGSWAKSDFTSLEAGAVNLVTQNYCSITTLYVIAYYRGYAPDPPEQATPYLPADDDTIETKTPTLSLTNSPGAGRTFRFRIYFGGDLVVTSIPLSESCWTIPPGVSGYHLANGDPYTWDAQLIADGADTTYFSPRRDFRILIPLDGGIIPASPLNASTVNSSTVTFKVASPTQTGNEFAFRVFNSGGDTLYDTTDISNPRFQVTGLADGDYSWECRQLIDGQPLCPYLTPQWTFTVAAAESVLIPDRPTYYRNTTSAQLGTFKDYVAGASVHYRWFRGDSQVGSYTGATGAYNPGALDTGVYNWDAQLIVGGESLAYSTPRVPYHISSPTRYGWVSATSSPSGATVYLDGIDAAADSVTPTLMDSVRVGDVIVTMMLDGYETFADTVTVTANDTITVYKEWAPPSTSSGLMPFFFD